MEVDLETIRAAIREELEGKVLIDKKIAREHFEYVQDKLDRRRRWRDSKARIREQVLGWGTISLLGTMGYLLLSGLLSWIQNVLKATGHHS